MRRSFAAYRIVIRGRQKKGFHLPGVNKIAEPVGAEQQRVAGTDVQPENIAANGSFQSDGPHDHVLSRMGTSLILGDQSAVHHALHERMIRRDLLELAVRQPSSTGCRRC